MALSLAAIAACFPNHATPLPACEARLGRDVARGALAILPSLVPGVVVDSAHWRSETASPEMSTQTGVGYSAFLNGNSVIPLSTFDVQFHSDRAEEDGELRAKGTLLMATFIGGREKGMLGVRMGHDSLRPGETRWAMARFSHSGKKAGDWGCPRSVQIVPADAPLAPGHGGS
ncbi:MAG: hypothetical protein ABIY52_17230 [Gemmatimonadaceae bacterium]